jgi:hypothetical protein
MPRCSNYSLLFRLTNQNFVRTSHFPMRAISPTHPIFLDLIILMIRSKEFKLWSTSACSFLQLPVTSLVFGPNIPLSTLSSHTLSLYSSRNATKSQTQTQQHVTLQLRTF